MVNSLIVHEGDKAQAWVMIEGLGELYLLMAVSAQAGGLGLALIDGKEMLRKKMNTETFTGYPYSSVLSKLGKAVKAVFYKMPADKDWKKRES